MGKPLVVHEFDTIIGKNEYNNFSDFICIGETQFAELIAFIKEYIAYGNDSDATEFMKIGYKRGVGDTVTLNNYVGLIELPSGFQIEVMPKVSFVNNEAEDRTRKVFLRMLQCLKDFQGKAFTNASLKSDRMNLYEIFINMYISEVQILVKHGLKAAYNEQEANLNYYKGKIKVSSNIKHNSAHKERFYMSYDEYSVNRPENRIIKATLMKLMKVSSSDENKKEIRKLLVSFEMIDESYNYDKDFSLVIIDRNTKDYSTLMTWSKVFLYNKSFTTFAGNTSGRALLFPMEKVFEEYVAKWVKRVFEDDGWAVSSQDRGYHLFDSPSRFALRPDIVAKKDNVTVILDTKWKRLYPGVHNYGISQADMYQMYVYSKKYEQNGCPQPEVWMLYPTSEVSDGIIDREFISDDGVIVHIYFVNVDYEIIDKNIRELLERINNKADEYSA